MRKVTVNKDKLLEALWENKDKHEKDFEELYTKFFDSYHEELTRVMDAILAKKIAHVDEPVMPVNHTKDYERAIRMVEMSLDDDIELDEQRFNELVMDEWDWQRSFTATKAFYGMG